MSNHQNLSIRSMNRFRTTNEYFYRWFYLNTFSTSLGLSLGTKLRDILSSSNISLLY